MNVSSQKRHTGKLAFAAASIFSVTAHASDVTGSPMVLIAYENAAGGASVLAHKFDAALAEIEQARTTSSDAYTAKINNRCVAYAAMKQITLALRACDLAVKEARSERLNAQRYSLATSVQDAYVAIAYANRAVVHMMAKDAESAKADMTHAKALAPSAKYVTQNMLAMATTASKIAQADVAPVR
jgi:tetratricopeptide (TPR) repeat protein